MTKIESAKKILVQGYCDGILCSECFGGHAIGHQCKASTLECHVPLSEYGGLDAKGRAFLKACIEREEKEEIKKSMTSIEKAKRLIETRSCRDFNCSADGEVCPAKSCFEQDFGNPAAGAFNDKGVEAMKKWLAEHEGVKPITAFEPGHWYQWIGPREYRDNWNDRMEAWKDGKPRKCINNRVFEEIEGDWNYSECMQYFREVPAPATITLHGSFSPIGKLQQAFCRCGFEKIAKTLGDKDKKIKTKAQRRREILARLSIE